MPAALPGPAQPLALAGGSGSAAGFSDSSGVLTGEFRCVHLALSGGGPGRSARRPGTEMGLLKSKREKRGWDGPYIPADVKN